MLASSFVGARLNKLFEAPSLHELWDLAFKTEVPAVPEMMLAKKIEEEAERRFVGDYMRLLSMYSAPDALPVELLRFFDYENLKELGAHLIAGREGIPDFVDIGEYSMLHWNNKGVREWVKNAAKDADESKAIQKLVEDSPVSWYTPPDAASQAETDSRLDRQYVRDLWQSVKKLPRSERHAVKDFLQEDIILQNILWALRLKVYYGMTPPDIIPRLVFATGVQDKNDPLAGPALKALEYPADDWDTWSSWKYRALLNPHEEGVYWTIDPRWVQQSAKRKQYHAALSRFHRHPFTAAVLLTWFVIKQYEADCIRTAAEGIRLNADKNAIQDFAGVV
jgi:vacuolar-type H+-ATPase subunit C/Vma6